MMIYMILTLADLICGIPCPWQWSDDARTFLAAFVCVELPFDVVYGALCIMTWRCGRKNKEANNG